MCRVDYINLLETVQDRDEREGRRKKGMAGGKKGGRERELIISQCSLPVTDFLQQRSIPHHFPRHHNPLKTKNSNMRVHERHFSFQ